MPKKKTAADYELLAESIGYHWLGPEVDKAIADYLTCYHAVKRGTIKKAPQLLRATEGQGQKRVVTHFSITPIIPCLLTSLLIFADFTQKNGPREAKNFMNIATNLTKITPQLATDYLSDKYHYPFNRNVKKLHVAFLADAMAKKRFDPTAQIAFACVPNEKDYLINGQHTLKAIIKCDLAHTLNVIKYNVKTFDDVHSLFSHYDIGTNRTFGDSVRAFGVAERTEIPSLYKPLRCSSTSTTIRIAQEPSSARALF